MNFQTKCEIVLREFHRSQKIPVPFIVWVNKNCELIIEELEKEKEQS